MDEQSVRSSAEVHANATVAGDLRTAGSDLTKEGAADAGGVMARLPRSLDSAEILDAIETDDGWTVRIAYRGEGREVVVESSWAERDGEPKIVGLAVP